MHIFLVLFVVKSASQQVNEWYWQYLPYNVFGGCTFKVPHDMLESKEMKFRPYILEVLFLTFFYYSSVSTVIHV